MHTYCMPGMYVLGYNSEKTDKVLDLMGPLAFPIIGISQNLFIASILQVIESAQRITMIAAAIY